MKDQMRIRDYGYEIGKLKVGDHNSITDVEGVTVGHATLDEFDIKTGVTAILPHQGNIFREKVMAACCVINGFGKSMGLIQIEELGTIETPIILTNTLSIGIAADALIEYMIHDNIEIGRKTGTVNPIVCECNDGYLNDIRGRHVKKEHIFKAIQSAFTEFKEGSVGAGTGMSCFGLKGGIGTSSRVFELEDQKYTLGVLVLSNFGSKEDFILNGMKSGEMISKIKDIQESDKGSIVVIVATDIPLTERQLKRVCKRAGVGISRTGSYIGNGSGDIILAFTTANKVKHYEEKYLIDIKMFNENSIDTLFRATVEATEEAILNSMICAETTSGIDGHKRSSLKEYMEIIKNSKY